MHANTQECNLNNLEKLANDYNESILIDSVNTSCTEVDFDVRGFNDSYYNLNSTTQNIDNASTIMPQTTDESRAIEI